MIRFGRYRNPNYLVNDVASFKKVHKLQLTVPFYLQTGQTPLSIAHRLGYISVVEILRHVTEVQVPDKAADEKYKVVSPETMQETLMTDSEDEGGLYQYC